MAPRLDIAAKIAEGAGVSLDWLVWGRGDGAPQDDGIVRLPRYDVHLAAGAGSWNEGRKQLENIPVTKSFLEQLRRSNGAALHGAAGAWRLDGAHVTDRALVIVDESAREPFDDVFAFVLAGEARVKRFRRTADGLMLISDNERYQPEMLGAEDLQRLQIIGQVLGVLQSI